MCSFEWQQSLFRCRVCGLPIKEFQLVCDKCQEKDTREQFVDSELERLEGEE